MLLGSLGVALAALPAVEIGWKGDRAQLVVAAPDGFEISADAPADLILRWEGRSLALEAYGAEMTGGIALGAVRGRALEGEMAVQLCEKASGVCTPASFALTGTVPDKKRGRVQLDVAQPNAPDHGPKFNSDASIAADAAFAAAKSDGGLVVLDFSAVWCPPCNLLAAEVLQAPDADEILTGFHVAVLDVDHPSSWSLKDRYEVGSYPTIVIVDAKGTELDRRVGYDGREAFLTFLADATGEKRDWDAEDPAGLSPDEAAEGLWAQVSSGVESGLEHWVEASYDSDSVEAHLAMFRLEPNPDDAAWLADNAPERALEWVPWAGAWGEEEDAIGPLSEAIQHALPEASGHEAADLLYFAAQLASDETEAATLYGAAYATLRESLAGDDLLDRPHWTFLATLQARSGDLDGAVASLDSLTRSHPDEPTFLLKAATLLNDDERYDEALERSKLAMSRSWGDNQLRVALAHCEALVGLGRSDEARATADKLLHADAAPDEKLEVRTHRYRQQLQAFLD